MNLKCAILYKDDKIVDILKEYISRIPYLSLTGCHTNPMSALKAYYETKVELYFVGIYPVEEGGISGMDFCRMLAEPTRVIFITPTNEHAANCFRLDALDYLTGTPDFTHFFQAVNKAVRWFSLQANSVSTSNTISEEETNRTLCIKSNGRIMRIDLHHINYIESLGDYVRIHCTASLKPLMTLCTMKHMEEHLPQREFVRIHRSFIVRLGSIHSIGRSEVVIDGRSIPIGEAYKERFMNYISQLEVL